MLQNKDGGCDGPAALNKIDNNHTPGRDRKKDYYLTPEEGQGRKEVVVKMNSDDKTEQLNSQDENTTADLPDVESFEDLLELVGTTGRWNFMVLFLAAAGWYTALQGFVH